MKKTLLWLVVISLVGLADPGRAADAQKIGTVEVSKWRGFNLLEKFNAARNAPFVENDFKWIAELGFNYVRLPMDYRCYVAKENWLQFREDVLKEIDQAIAFGERYQVHVSINLHRAPGFCINPPAEPKDLWTDAEALEAFVAHWVMFARRYQHVPVERLSFNLLNEPARSSREDYLKVFQRTIEAIQKVDPKRLIIVDGMNVGRDPMPEFLKYANVIQSTRGYHPGQISHFKASWVKGSDQWPTPGWPLLNIPGHLYGPSKPEYKSPLLIQGEFKAGTQIAITLNQLSVRAKLVAQADGKIVAEKMFDPKASPAEWQPVKSETKYVLHEPVKEIEFTITLKESARAFSLENADGDWLKFSELTIRSPDGQRHAHRTDLSWGRPQATLLWSGDGSLRPPPGVKSDQILADYLKAWREIAAQGETVFVGEWGCYNKTPHPVALAWMKSWLEQWQEARFGWALWNFRGTFGILDSGRSDVAYEDWRGHKLDRAMLELLQQYRDY